MALPRVTSIVLMLTALLTAMQFVHPGILETLQRSPSALSGEWWRLVTPIFIERGGWREIAANLVGLGVVGFIVEHQCGPRRWLGFYVLGGIAGEVAGLWWRPYGAGSSVAVCGLLGVLAVSLLSRKSWSTRGAGAAIALAGLTLTLMHNLHGPPIVIAAVIAGGSGKQVSG